MSQLLPIFDGLVRADQYDNACRALANRHYSRQSPESPMFTPPGRKLILRDVAGTACFVWMDMIRDDGQEGYNCCIFRNESPRRSSEIILEAEEIVSDAWGAARLFTYVDPSKVRSTNPGYCFLVAGWSREGESKTGKILLSKWHAVKKETTCETK